MAKFCELGVESDVVIGKGIDMEDLFKVKWIGPDSKHRFINVHYNDERTKILIHTMQLSYFSYDLLEGIARHPIFRDTK